MSLKEKLLTLLVKNANIKQELLEPLINDVFNEDSNQIPEPFEIGKTYYVESYTKYWHFRVLGFTKEGLLKVENLSWIAHTGRYSVGLKNYEFDEIESVDGIFYLPFQGFTLIKETPLITLKTK